MVQYLSKKVCSEGLSIFNLRRFFHGDRLKTIPMLEYTREYRRIVYRFHPPAFVRASCSHKNFTTIISVPHYPLLSKKWMWRSSNLLSFFFPSTKIAVLLLRRVLKFNSSNNLSLAFLFLIPHVLCNDCFNRLWSVSLFIILTITFQQLPAVLSIFCQAPFWDSTFNVFSRTFLPDKNDGRQYLPDLATALGGNGTMPSSLKLTAKS